MKRILLLAVTIMSVTGFIFAQNDGFCGQNMGGQVFERRAGLDRETVTLNGTLEWVNGRIAVKTEDKTYFTPGIRELVGFVDGLKEGAGLTLTGKAHNIAYISEYGFFRTEKVTFNGKDYVINGEGHDGIRFRNGTGGMARRGWR
ncbi:MAG: hypothetical protein LBP37_04525 [Spirochaetaceae bacterium]|jgi:hypothetical protein|nr:hypothetical protein [Spirochaetaceae bacterium]